MDWRWKRCILVETHILKSLLLNSYNHKLVINDAFNGLFAVPKQPLMDWEASLLLNLYLEFCNKLFCFDSLTFLHRVLSSIHDVCNSEVKQSCA